MALDEKWTVWESERKYHAITKYDNLNSFNERTCIIIDTGLFKPKQKPEDFNVKNTFGYLAKVTSVDGMCHMTFNIVATSKLKYFELEFYDTVVYSYGVPKLQKIYADLSKHIDLNITELPNSVEEFLELLITWFEALEPVLLKHRDKQRVAAEKAKIETTLADSNIQTIIE